MEKKEKQKIDFKDRVLSAVKKVRNGETMTYSQIAKMAGSPRAARAVGDILSKNYNPKIPCHRVNKSSGQVGNYNRGGSDAKRTLLDQEKSQVSRKCKTDRI